MFYGTMKGSWFMIGFMRLSTMSGNKPRMKMAATRMKTGMSMRLFSLMAVSSLGFLPYMTLMRRKM